MNSQGFLDRLARRAAGKTDTSLGAVRPRMASRFESRVLPGRSAMGLPSQPGSLEEEHNSLLLEMSEYSRATAESKSTPMSPVRAATTARSVAREFFPAVQNDYIDISSIDESTAVGPRVPHVVTPGHSEPHSQTEPTRIQRTRERRESETRVQETDAKQHAAPPQAHVPTVEIERHRDISTPGKHRIPNLSSPVSVINRDDDVTRKIKLERSGIAVSTRPLVQPSGQSISRDTRIVQQDPGVGLRPRIANRQEALPTSASQSLGPVIQVTIGRIEVRASAVSPSRSSVPAPPPGESLSAYLRQRDGRR